MKFRIPMISIPTDPLIKGIIIRVVPLNRTNNIRQQLSTTIMTRRNHTCVIGNIRNWRTHPFRQQRQHLLYGVPNCGRKSYGPLHLLPPPWVPFGYGPVPFHIPKNNTTTNHNKLIRSYLIFLVTVPKQYPHRPCFGYGNWFIQVQNTRVNILFSLRCLYQWRYLPGATRVGMCRVVK